MNNNPKVVEIRELCRMLDKIEKIIQNCGDDDTLCSEYSNRFNRILIRINNMLKE